MECGGTLTHNNMRIRSTKKDGTKMQRKNDEGEWITINSKLTHPIKAIFRTLIGLKKKGEKHEAEIRG